MEEVILVDSKDNPIGGMEKLEAHRKGLLHRAFSIILFNPKGEIMLQQRAAGKYHSANLWTNTCCSHPRPEESTVYAANRRLKEEMGINEELRPLYKFIYRYQFSADLIEHEFDHVYFGETEKVPQLNLNEAASWRWVSWNDLLQEIKSKDEEFTFWFKEIIKSLQHNPLILPKHLRPVTK